MKGKCTRSVVNLKKNQEGSFEVNSEINMKTMKMMEDGVDFNSISCSAINFLGDLGLCASISPYAKWK